METVLILTSAHPALDIRIFFKEARALVNNGRIVILIAPHPMSEEVDGVRIIGTKKPVNRFTRMIVSVSNILLLALRSKAAICHFHDPELIPVGIILKFCGRRVIYDVHEDLPRQILSKHWIHPIFRRTISVLAELTEYISAKIFDRIITATPTIAKRFPYKKTVTIQNFPFVNELKPTSGAPYISRPYIVAYVGVLTETRGLNQMLKTMELIDGFPLTRLHIAGSIDIHDLTCSKAASPAGWLRTEFLGEIDRTQVQQLLSQARLGLVLFHPEPNHINAQPNKLFEYMSAGIPVIASDFPLWREIIGDTGAGLLVDPLNPDQIARAIEWIFTHEEEAEIMGKRGQKAVQILYNWEIEQKKLLEMYQKLEEEIQNG